MYIHIMLQHIWWVLSIFNKRDSFEFFQWNAVALNRPDSSEKLTHLKVSNLQRIAGPKLIETSDIFSKSKKLQLI